MQTALLAGWVLWSAIVAIAPAQRPVATVLGPKGFLDGDVIVITDVQSTSPRLEQGDTVTVRGRYRLASREDAQLALYVTATESKGVGDVESEQTMQVTDRRGEFELKTTIECRGMLHVTFYDNQSGKGFGGVYFGTPEQMKQIEGWDWAYYRQDDSRREQR
jgi:hypothetical protein